MIGLKNVYKSYGERKVFSDLSIEFEPNRITAILGGSGVGKTTILRLLSGLTDPDSGEVFGANPVSFVFQEDRLAPHLTVNQNLELVLGKGDYSAALADVGLEGRGNDYPKGLSGGMARRLCFLRACLFPSELILLDEPFKGLDLKLKYAVMDAFLDLWKKNPRTAVLVTHDPEEAAYVASRAIVLDDGAVKADFLAPNVESLRSELLR